MARWPEKGIVPDKPAAPIITKKYRYPHLASQAAVDGSEQEARELSAKLMPHIRERVLHPQRPTGPARVSPS